VTFAKVARDFGKDMPKNQKKLATDSAILAKLLSDNVVVIDELKFEAPKTKDFAAVLNNLKINRSCIVSVDERDVNVYKSARNIQKVDVIAVSDLNAGEICSHSKILFTKEAITGYIASRGS
jgi:large subunit ribosomal protein L4